MKIREHFDVPKDNLPAFLKELAGNDFTIISNAETKVYHITTEVDYTEPEFNMLTLRTLLNNSKRTVFLTDEEKNALEYAISCIKTLADMGVIS